jgi:hypothetical protein
MPQKNISHIKPPKATERRNRDQTPKNLTQRRKGAKERQISEELMSESGEKVKRNDRVAVFGSML